MSVNKKRTRDHPRVRVTLKLNLYINHSVSTRDPTLIQSRDYSLAGSDIMPFLTLSTN